MDNQRTKINRQRVADAFFTYAFLDLNERWEKLFVIFEQLKTLSCSLKMGISSDLGRLEKRCRVCHFGTYVTLQVVWLIDHHHSGEKNGQLCNFLVVFTSSLHHHNHHHHHHQILFHLRSQFHAIWGSHKCEVKGCGEWLTCDGGMKPRRYLNCIYSNFDEVVLFQQCVRCEVQWSQDLQTQCNKGGIWLHSETQPWPPG